MTSLLNNTADDIFFSGSHGTFSRIHHELGHNIYLNTYKRTEIIPSMSSDYNGMEIEINTKKIGALTSM